MKRTDSRQETTPAHSAAFTATSWTAVVTASQPDSQQAQQALTKLCQTYWLPLYAYVRRLGYSEDDAKDLTQQFFFVLLSKNYLGAADRAKGKFRSFLLTAFKHFLSNERERALARRRGGKSEIISLDQVVDEEGHHLEPSSDLSPVKMFERHWAMMLFERARTRLREEYEAAGKGSLFNHIKAFLDGFTESGEYAEVAAQMHMSAGAVAMSVHRMRHHFGELVRSEIAQTLIQPTATEIEEELRHLFDTVSR